MKTAVALVALTLFGLAPSIGSACEYNDAKSASVSPVEQMAAASAPAATKVPAPNVVKATAQTPAKTTVKVKQVADQRVAASGTN
jgi:hypothetical protein